MGASTPFLHLIFFLVVLLTPAASAEIWNIDCGAAKGYYDNTTKLSWLGDSEYVVTGESYSVTDPSIVDPTYMTLRAFPKNKKNCYTIPVPAGTKIMVRTGFYYGNYDGQSKPPTFELMYDGNDWFKVVAEVNSNVVWTMIYVTGRNGTDVCLGRLNDDDDPFVSFIQVVSLEPEMYVVARSGFTIYSPMTFAFGSNTTIRSPDDPYDRLWTVYRNLSTVLSPYETLHGNKSLFVNTTKLSDRPPNNLFNGAIVPKASNNLTIATTFLGQNPLPVYLSMYFTEVVSNLSQQRTLNIYQDDELISQSPLTLTLGKALDFRYLTNASDSTRFTIAATSDSILPPLISGFQIFYATFFPSLRTNTIDVDALSMLQGNFLMLRNWSGDPCLPVKFNWEWVSCSSDNSPRITKLYLGGYGLSGDIPDFSALDALVTIALQRNKFQGDIPEFLGNFPHLQVLNLADNDFSSIPPILTNNSKLIVNVTGNQKLCENGKTCIYGPFATTGSSKPPPPPLSNSSSSNVITSSSLFFMILSVIAVILCH